MKLSGRALAFLLVLVMAKSALAQADSHEPLSIAYPRDSRASMRSSAEPPAADREPMSLEDKPASGAEDRMEDIQSFNTYTSLEDGQPGQRGEFQINYSNGWVTRSNESDPWLMLMEIEYSPNAPGNWLLSNAKFGIDVPLELGNGGIDGNGDVILVWKQRIIEEQQGDWYPTFTIENELRTPTGYHSSGVDWTLQGVVAKELGPGTAVLNLFLKSANGRNNLEEGSSWWNLGRDDSDEELRHFQWGFRVGYKWRITDEFAVVADYLNQTSEETGEHNENIGECAVEWRVNDHLTIGPGIMFGLDGAADTPHFGAGVLLHCSW